MRKADRKSGDRTERSPFIGGVNLSPQESGQETREDCCVIVKLCRNMYIRHGSISYLSGLV